MLRNNYHFKVSTFRVRLRPNLGKCGVTYILRVQYSCGIVFVFWFWQEIVLGAIYILRVQYSCAVVSVFWLWQEIVLKMRTPFDFL
jgi:hypothetical protein